jgi:hypothetical protein
MLLVVATLSKISQAPEKNMSSVQTLCKVAISKVVCENKSQAEEDSAEKVFVWRKVHGNGNLSQRSFREVSAEAPQGYKRLTPTSRSLCSRQFTLQEGREADVQ